MEIILVFQNAVNKMVNEPATWSSFSGSLAKTVKDEKIDFINKRN